jgi:hypothetical protein
MIRFINHHFLLEVQRYLPILQKMASESIGWMVLVLSMNDNALKEKNYKGFKTFSMPGVQF